MSPVSLQNREVGSKTSGWKVEMQEFMLDGWSNFNQINGDVPRIIAE